MKKILFAASECVPFIKTGGLADVCGALPKTFDHKDWDVRVVIPNYSCIPEKYRSQFEYVTHFYMACGSYIPSKYVGVLQYKLDGVTYYFIDNQEYFNCFVPYGDMRYDIEKFTFFDKAVLSMLPLIGFRPDIIHCHDWQTGLVPIYLDNFRYNNEFFRGIKTVITIHNLKFQGVWDVQTIKNITGLSDYYFTADKLEAYKDANYLKGGIVFADAVTTVSNTYAEEIKTPFYGEKLDGLMCARANSLRGIVNGIDYNEFNPETDPYITKTYNATTFRKEKVKNKLQLQRDLGLQEDPKTMMIGIVSRLTDQKGFDLIAYIMDELLSTERVQFVVAGTGEARYQDMLSYFAGKYPDKMKVHIGYSEELAHQIYASCDAFLMPSLFEPCGLSQLMSLRYGTVPIVRETGGLKDTVIPYNEYTKEGTGFSFANYNAHEMLATIRYALSVFYQHKNDWDILIKHGMSQDFSWNASVAEYEKLYDSLMTKFTW